MDYIVAAWGRDLYYTKRVGLASFHGGGSSRQVRVLAEGESPGQGVEHVLIVDSDYDELVSLENPEDLPFWVKVELYGPPSCPRCGTKLRGHPLDKYFGCDRCRFEWPAIDFITKYWGKLW